MKLLSYEEFCKQEGIDENLVSSECEYENYVEYIQQKEYSEIVKEV